VPLADAHRRLGDLDKALALIQEGLDTYPDFASAHLVLGWVHRSRQEPDDAMRSFERVLALDAENTVARAAIAELIEDQTGEDERLVVPIASLAPVVPIASLAPGAPVETVPASDAAPALVPDSDRRVVPIASLAPAGQDETSAAPDAVPESAPDLDDRPVVPIASLAPVDQDESSASRDAAPESERDPDDGPVVRAVVRSVVPIPSLAPEGSEEASFGDGPIDGEIYTQTLAELYVTQGATGRAIEVYLKLIADDPDNETLLRRLTELESLESGADGAPAQLDVRAGLGELVAGLEERQTVSIKSLAPDGDAGES